MAKHSPLTLTFLKQKPVAAGRELAAMTANEAATFLDAVPTRIAAPVLAAMGAWSAAVVVNHMAAPSAAAALRAVDYQDAAAILRNLSVSERTRVLNDLPEKLRRDFETSLAFPSDTVGAHLTTAILALSERHLVGDAIDLIRRSKMFNSDVVFIVDKERRLTGAVSATSLLKHSRDISLGDIMDRKIASISARSTLLSLDGLSGWSDYNVLPVVSRQNHVIGALSRKVLEHGYDHHHPAKPDATSSIVISMLDAFAASTLGLARTLAGTGSVPTTENGRQP